MMPAPESADEEGGQDFQSRPPWLFEGFVSWLVTHLALHVLVYPDVHRPGHVIIADGDLA